MAINFPASPSVNDTFTVGSITYQCVQNNPTKWIGLGVTPADRLVEGSNTVDLNGNNLEIGGTPAWSVTGGNYNNLSIRGGDASSSGFMWLGNGTATNNGDFDLGRINFLNGPTIVAQIKGTTETSANDDGRISFFTKSTGNNTTERLRVRTNGIQVTGRIFINGTNAGFDYNSVADTLEVLTTNAGTHSEFNANAFVPAGTKNLGANASRWNTLYIATGIDFAGNDNASGMTSEVLDDYEEGNYSPGWVNATGVNYIAQKGQYVKVGTMVYVWGEFQFSTFTSFPNGWDQITLPFAGTRIGSQTNSLSNNWWAVTSGGTGQASGHLNFGPLGHPGEGSANAFTNTFLTGNNGMGNASISSIFSSSATTKTIRFHMCYTAQ